ncbi:MAG: hypothetical protein WA814_04935 [Candidatus Baltobacteraceae bacterium]
MQPAVQTRAFGPIPLILGVTGHRDLPDDVGPLEDAVRKILVEFQTRHPWSKIVLLSSLAEGADRLVARLALELGISLVVPLPLQQSDYETDFETPVSVAEFRSLLERADAAFVVPPAPRAANGDASRDARSVAYANCGAYLVRKSIEIVALWDGVSNPVRGTAEVVAFQLEGVPAPYVADGKELDLSAVGPVKHVETPRGAEAGDSRIDEPGPRTIYPSVLADGKGAKAFEKAKADIDRFNRDVVESAARGGEPRSVRESADAVAAKYRSRTTRALTSIFALVFLSVVGFNVYGNMASHPLWVLSAYLTSIALAFAAYYFSKRGDWQNRYQDCRALAETLRVAHYWRMAGIDEPVADVFAENHRAEIDWLPFAIRTVTEPLVAEEPPPAADDEIARLRRIYEEWIVHEYRYFTAFAGRRERRRSEASARIVSVALLLSIVVTISMRLLPSLGVSQNLDRLALLTATVLALVAALLSSYAEKRGWAEHVRRYEMMAVLFRRARERVAAALERDELGAQTVARIREILRTLGEESIREGATWLSLHRSRPIDVPQA